MSPASRRIARRSPHVEIARRRRRNYAFLAEQLVGLSGARPLRPTLPNGTCPLAFPLVVDEPSSLLRHLASNGIGAELFWSDFHPAFPAQEFPESTYLKTHVVTLADPPGPRSRPLGTSGRRHAPVVAGPMTGPSPAKSGRPAIAIIRRGSFSSINDAFLAAFTKLLPGYDFEVVDVLELMENEGLVFKVRARLVALKEFTRLLLLRRERMGGAGGCMIRTTFYFEQLRRRLAERLSGRTYVFTLQTQSLFDGSLPGVPHFVYTDHAELQCLSLPGFSPEDLFPPRFIALETSIYKNAEMVFTMSDATRRCLVEEYGCPEEQVAWVRAGPNAPPNGEVPVPDRYESQRILFVAARWEPKGGPELAAAFERLLATHPRAELTIVGCSPALDLPNCEVVGPVPVGLVGAYYDRASVFCLPTRREAYGIAFLEALAHGLPVVATRVGALPELVSEGETGYLVEVGDVDALTSRLTALLDDPEACRRFGLAARRIGASYTWAGTAQTMLRHIERVVGPL